MRKALVLALLFAFAGTVEARGNRHHGAPNGAPGGAYYVYGLGVGLAVAPAIYYGYRTYYPPAVYYPPSVYYPPPPVYYEQYNYSPPQGNYYPPPQQSGCTTWHWAQDYYGNWIKQLDC